MTPDPAPVADAIAETDLGKVVNLLSSILYELQKQTDLIRSTVVNTSPLNAIAANTKRAADGVNQKGL